MNAQDLMFGDWVQIVSDAPVMPNEYHTVDWIRTGEIGLDNNIEFAEQFAKDYYDFVIKHIKK